MTAFNDPDLRPYFLRLPPKNIVMLKFIVESYEGIGIVRTLNSAVGEIVILAVKDTARELEKILEDLKPQLNFEPSEPPGSIKGDWLLEQSRQV